MASSNPCDGPFDGECCPGPREGTVRPSLLNRPNRGFWNIMAERYQCAECRLRFAGKEVPKPPPVVPYHEPERPIIEDFTDDDWDHASARSFVEGED